MRSKLVVPLNIAPRSLNSLGMFGCLGVPLKTMCSSKCAMPVSPYPSCREPTRTVRLTVTLGLETSGTSRTTSPLSSRYSLIPSTERTFFAAPPSSAITKDPRTSKTPAILIIRTAHPP